MIQSVLRAIMNALRKSHCDRIRFSTNKSCTNVSCNAHKGGNCSLDVRNKKKETYSPIALFYSRHELKKSSNDKSVTMYKSRFILIIFSWF